MTVAWVVLFGRLAVQNHRNFGTWSYDMGIYDQGFWLVSQGGSTFMTVRGLDFWGHHLNLIAFAFTPFYWLGAGPSFLYAAQAVALGLGAVPTYLIARDRFERPWIGLLFAFVYLMYAPIQWISWAMFHPEALVISPMLFAWWFATRQRWGWFFGAVLLRPVDAGGDGPGRGDDGARTPRLPARAAPGTIAPGGWRWRPWSSASRGTPSRSPWSFRTSTRAWRPSTSNSSTAATGRACPRSRSRSSAIRTGW